MNELKDYVLLRTKVEKEIKQLSDLQRKGLEDLLVSLKLDKDVYFRPDPKSPLLRGRIFIRKRIGDFLTPWYVCFSPNATKLSGVCYFAPDRLVKAVERGEIMEAKE